MIIIYLFSPTVLDVALEATLATAVVRVDEAAAVDKAAAAVVSADLSIARTLLSVMVYLCWLIAFCEK